MMLLISAERSKKYVILCLIAIWACVLSIAGYSFYVTERAINTERTKQQEKIQSYTKMISKEFNNGFAIAGMLLQDVGDAYNQISSGGAHAENDKPKLRDHLFKYGSRLPGISSLFIIQANGRQLVDAGAADAADFSQTPYFTAIKDKRFDTIVTPIEAVLADGKGGIHVARKIVDKNGEFAGVAVIAIGANAVFYEPLSQLGAPSGMHVQLRTWDKDYLNYPASYGEEEKQTSIENFIVKTLKNNQPTGLFEFVDDKTSVGTLVAYQKLNNSGLYAVVVSPDESQLAAENDYWPWFFGLIFTVLVAAGFGSIIVIGAHKLKIAHQEAVDAAEQRKGLIKELNTIAEDERRNIAHEMHDTMNATLIAIKLDANAIKSRTQDSPEELFKFITSRSIAIEKSAQVLYSFCRSLVAKLRPEVLDLLGLENAIEELVSGFNDRNIGCTIHFHCSGPLNNINKVSAIALYRVIQESVTNIQKHAHAKTVLISLEVDAGAGIANLHIEDDGVGFSNTTKARFGLIGMQERIESLDGTFKVTSSPGQGVSIEVTAPI